MTAPQNTSNTKNICNVFADKFIDDATRRDPQSKNFEISAQHQLYAYYTTGNVSFARSQEAFDEFHA